MLSEAVDDAVRCLGRVVTVVASLLVVNLAHGIGRARLRMVCRTAASNGRRTRGRLSGW